MRLKNMLTNFVSNAIKFSDHGTITLRARLLNADKTFIKVHFEVKDEGIGLNEAQIATVFNTFEQVDKSSTHKYGGTELGLAICKQLALLMGGEISVRSQPGQGSTFWITIPLERSEVTAVPAAMPNTASDWQAARQVVSHLAARLAEFD